MALDSYLSSLDELPEVFREHYVAAGDGFTLDVHSVDGRTLEDVGSIKSALARERTTAAKSAKALKAFEGIDADLAREAMAKIGEMADWSPDEQVQERIAAREKQLMDKHAAEIQAATAANADLDKHLRSFVVDAALAEAIAKHKGNATLLMPLLRAQIEVDRDDGGEFFPRVVDSAGNTRITDRAGATDGMSVDELVKSLRDDSTTAAAFAGSVIAGSGATPSSGGSARPGQLDYENTPPPDLIAQARARANGV